MAEENDQAALQEKLKNMSPEELKEYQKKNCIFCQIVVGNVASKKIYEDDKIIAILDINPANPGHLLVMPKEHYAIMPLMPEDILGHLAMVTKALSHALLKALKAEGTTIFIANGMSAGQRAQHFMLHIIPRKEGDNVGLMIPQNNISENDLATIQQRLVARVNELFGASKSEIAESGEKPNAEIKKPDTPKTPQQPEKFISSSKAKRYHRAKCPFAQNIPKDNAIIGTFEDMENQGKKPCTCVTGKKIPLKKGEKQNVVEADYKDIEQKNSKRKEKGVNLDDISRLIIGK